MSFKKLFKDEMFIENDLDSFSIFYKKSLVRKIKEKLQHIPFKWLIGLFLSSLFPVLMEHVLCWLHII